MAINPVLLQNQVEKFPDIYQDYQNIKHSVNPDAESDNIVFEALPVYGKVHSLPEKLANNDYHSASALATLAVLNGPEEINDVFSALKQIKSAFTGKKYDKPYDNKIAQHPFSFFRGSLLRDYMNPNSPDCVFPAISRWLLKQDKSLLDTRLGDFVCKKLNIELGEIPTTIKSIYHTNEKPKFVLAKTFKTNNPLKDLVGRTLARTTKIGTLALGGVEALRVKNEVESGKNFFVEAGKSAATLGVTVTGIGTLGALGAKYFGPTGSFVGIGAGAVLGALTSKLLDS